jgi:hypothetical protein
MTKSRSATYISFLHIAAMSRTASIGHEGGQIGHAVTSHSVVRDEEEERKRFVPSAAMKK